MLPRSPIFAISSASPKSSARAGQASTHTGFSPAATRSAHPLQRTAFFFSSSTFGALYGHTMAHVPQPMHFSSSMDMRPVSASLMMALCGHFSKQTGESQWLHDMDSG